MISIPPEFILYSNNSTATDKLEAQVFTASTANDSILLADSDLATINAVPELQSFTRASQNQSDVFEPMEWTPKLEKKFNRLAQLQALDNLSLKDQIEFEKLSAYRRQLKNPRTGEEVVAEYEQRLLTRDLVRALAKYVEWHKQYASNNSR